MAKRKTVEKTVEKKVEQVENTQKATPDMPEAEVSEEKAQEFEEKYTEKIPELPEIGKVQYSTLWKNFIPTYILDSDATVYASDERITVSAIDPSKIAAMRVTANVISDYEGYFGVMADVQAKIIRYKATGITLKGENGVPTQAVVTGGISINREQTKLLKLSVPLIEPTTQDAESVSKIFEKFESERKWTYTIDVKQFLKTIKEFAAEFSHTAFLTIDSKLVVYGESKLGAMASVLTETIPPYDVGFIGMYPNDYLLDFAKIMDKFGIATAELRFSNKDAPLWLHGEKDSTDVDLVVAPRLLDEDSEQFLAVARAIL